MQSYFDQLERVRFEGTHSTNPLAFRHYNPDEIVLGKRMEEHLRFAACYWHTFCWNGADMFGIGSFDRPWQQPGEAAFCLIEEAVNLENEMIDEWIVFRWKRVYPADVFLKFPADDWEKELIETFAGYSHEEIDLERYRKRDRAKF